MLSAVGMRGAPDVHSHHRANEGGPPPISAITRQDILRRTQLRRRIDKLKENRMQREDDVERNRRAIEILSPSILLYIVSKLVHIMSTVTRI